MKEHTQALIERVCEHFSLSQQQLLYSLKNEAVTARHALVYALYKDGYTPRYIAECLPLSARAIAYAVRSFDARLRQTPYLRRKFEALMKEL